MIITRVPFRISFFGGGTDYPEWYREHGGRVLSTTIDKYCYVSLRWLPRFFDHRVRVAYSKVEHCASVSEILHPSFREIFRFMGVEADVEAHYDADLPARSGMGSSSAFAVGLLQALYALKDRPVSALQLAEDAIHVEREVLGETVGSQDQVAVAHGGLNRIEFAKDESISVTPSDVAEECKEELEDSIMLWYTGQTRFASEVAQTYSTNLLAKGKEMRATGDMVDIGHDYLREGKIEAFGNLLNEAWELKSSLSSAVSNRRIADIYTAAKTAGAWGGKLLGAGGGGFVLLVVNNKRKAAVRQALSDLIEVPIKFENKGSKIVYKELNRIKKTDYD